MVRRLRRLLRRAIFIEHLIAATMRRLLFGDWPRIEVSALATPAWLRIPEWDRRPNYFLNCVQLH